MSLGFIRDIDWIPDLLKVTHLKKLYLFHLGRDAMAKIFDIIYDPQYSWSTEPSLRPEAASSLNNLVFTSKTSKIPFMKEKLLNEAMERALKVVFSKTSRLPPRILRSSAIFAGTHI